MKRAATILFVTTLLLAGTGIVAAQPALPAAGTTPDNPLYYAEIVYENVVGFLFTVATDSTEAEYRLGLAGERIAEVQAVIDKGSPDAAAIAVKRYGNSIQAAAKHAVAAQIEGEHDHTELLQDVKAAAQNHRATVSAALSAMPQEDQGAAKAALNANQAAMDSVDRALGEQSSGN